MAAVGGGQCQPGVWGERVGDAGDAQQREQAVGDGAMAEAPFERNAERAQQRAQERLGRVEVGREREQHGQHHRGGRGLAKQEHEQQRGD